MQVRVALPSSPRRRRKWHGGGLHGRAGQWHGAGGSHDGCGRSRSMLESLSPRAWLRRATERFPVAAEVQGASGLQNWGGGSRRLVHAWGSEWAQQRQAADRSRIKPLLCSSGRLLLRGEWLGPWKMEGERCAAGPKIERCVSGRVGSAFLQQHRLPPKDHDMAPGRVLSRAARCCHPEAEGANA
jgi:hypothetical protein